MPERMETMIDVQDQLGEAVAENNALKDKCSGLSKKAEDLTHLSNDLVNKLKASEKKCAELMKGRRVDEAMKVISVNDSMVSSYEDYKDEDLRQIAGNDLIKKVRTAGLMVSTPDFLVLRAGGKATHPVKVKYLKLLGIPPENVIPVNSFENSENVSISKSPRMGNNQRRNNINAEKPINEVVTVTKATDIQFGTGAHAESSRLEIEGIFQPGNNALKEYLSTNDNKEEPVSDSESVKSKKRKATKSDRQTRSKNQRNNVELIVEEEEVDMQDDAKIQK